MYTVYSVFIFPKGIHYPMHTNTEKKKKGKERKKTKTMTAWYTVVAGITMKVYVSSPCRVFQEHYPHLKISILYPHAKISGFQIYE